MHGEHSGMDGTVSAALATHVCRLIEKKLEGITVPLGELTASFPIIEEEHTIYLYIYVQTHIYIYII